MCGTRCVRVMRRFVPENRIIYHRDNRVKNSDETGTDDVAQREQKNMSKYVLYTYLIVRKYNDEVHLNKFDVAGVPGSIRYYLSRAYDERERDTTVRTRSRRDRTRDYAVAAYYTQITISNRRRQRMYTNTRGAPYWHEIRN